MDIKDIAVSITRIRLDTYQWPIDILSSTFNISHDISEKFSLWYFWIGHLSFATLCKYLTWLKVNFLNNISKNFVCGLCELSKAIKQYNWLLCPLLKMKYAKIHTDLVRLIILQGFSGEKYFFTFVNRAIKEIKTSIKRKKRNNLAI